MRNLNFQKGITLIELLIALSITSVIMGALTGVIYTVITVSGRGTDEAEALRDIRSAAFQISNDAQMAQSTSLEGGSPSANMTLTWNDQFGDPHSINYALYGSMMLRHYDGVRTVVAANIESLQFTVNDDVLTYTVTATPEGRWDVNRSFTGSVMMRAVP